MSWKPEVLVNNEWGRNGLVFETHDEAFAYAKDLFGRWTITEDFRAVEVDTAEYPVNYKIVDGKALSLDYLTKV